MKKSILTALFFVLGFVTSSAQFEAGKMYVGATFQGVDLSYSDATKLHLGVGGNVGYMADQDWMVLGEVGFDYSNSAFQKFYLGAAGRYYFEQNGVFLQGGLKYTHQNGGYNNFTFTPEVGYCFFLNKYLTVEPAVYWDMSFSDFSDKSCFGVKVGLGVFF